MTSHTVASFDVELASLTALLLEMGLHASHAVTFATEALGKSDSALAKQIIAADRAIDDLQHRIEERAVGIIARRQPVASDLRQIISCIRIANDFERIGDLAKNIAKRTLALTEAGTAAQGIATMHLGQLGERAYAALSDVTASLRTLDDAKAMAVWQRDHEIDAQYTALFRELLTYMMEDPRNIGPCAHLLFCAKNLERIGDHATNIAETIHYLVTGQPVRDERPKAEMAGLADESVQQPDGKG
jgi:phosphate transport system protein